MGPPGLQHLEIVWHLSSLFLAMHHCHILGASASPVLNTVCTIRSFNPQESVWGRHFVIPGLQRGKLRHREVTELPEVRHLQAGLVTVCSYHCWGAGEVCVPGISLL